MVVPEVHGCAIKITTKWSFLGWDLGWIKYPFFSKDGWAGLKTIKKEL
jgi:hypothetical protein